MSPAKKKPIKKKTKRNALGKGLSALMTSNLQPEEEIPVEIPETTLVEPSTADWRDSPDIGKSELSRDFNLPQTESVALKPEVKAPQKKDPGQEIAELRARLDKGIAREVAREFRNSSTPAVLPKEPIAKPIETEPATPPPIAELSSIKIVPDSSQLVHSNQEEISKKLNVSSMS